MQNRFTNITNTHKKSDQIEFKWVHINFVDSKWVALIGLILYGYKLI